MANRTQIYAFVGTDEAMVQESALKQARQLAPADNDFGLEIIAGIADNAGQVGPIIGRTLEAIRTLPFFGGDKVVWLQEANFFGDTETGKAEASVSAQETLMNYLEGGLPPDVTFILSATAIDKRRSFYKRLGKVAKITVHDRLDATKSGWERAVMQHVNDRANALGLKFSRSALERFTLRVGADTRFIDAELEKLSLYIAEKSVSDHDIDAIVSQSHTGFIFDIGEAISHQNLPLALKLIDFQLRREESPITILLAAIVPKVRSLLYVRDLMDHYKLSVSHNYRDFQQQMTALPPEATSHLPRSKDGGVNLYPLFLATSAASKFTLTHLRSAFEACLEANLRLVTTSLDPKVVLHQLAARILTGGEAPRR